MQQTGAKEGPFQGPDGSTRLVFVVLGFVALVIGLIGLSVSFPSIAADTLQDGNLHSVVIGLLLLGGMLQVALGLFWERK
jgi:hypothetical protein